MELIEEYVDDGYSTAMLFDDFRHFKNTFEKYGD